MMIQVTINGITRSVPRGTGLSALIKGEHPCGGKGTCGKCKVVARGALSPVTSEEERLLTSAELSAGVRLACKTKALGACAVETTDKADCAVVTEGEFSLSSIAPAFSEYGAAVDVGTTTLAAWLLDREGNRLAEASAVNPQGAFGADVMTRMEKAVTGEKENLCSLIVKAIDGLLKELKEKTKISVIDGLVITGNTVMLHLLCAADVTPMTRVPFAAKRLFGETLSASSLGLTQAEGAVYLPPCISAFVGADTVCAILSSDLCKGDDRLLADVGTNGEIVLWHDGALTVCSTAAGPAFEGAGLSSGMRGGRGAIDRVTIENDTLAIHTIGEEIPGGICGSGVVDAVACLLQLEILEESGYLEEDVTLAGVVTLTAKDIRMVQLAKSAVSAGIEALLHHGKITAEEIQSFFIAGGFGRYLNLENAAKIGLFPKGLLPVAQATGNSALSGAAMLLLNPALRETALSLARSATHLELACDPTFIERYSMGMFFE